MGDIKKLCHICGGIAAKNCRLCGRAACSTHLDSRTGICSSCGSGRK